MEVWRSSFGQDIVLSQGLTTRLRHSTSRRQRPKYVMERKEDKEIAFGIDTSHAQCFDCYVYVSYRSLVDGRDFRETISLSDFADSGRPYTSSALSA